MARKKSEKKDLSEVASAMDGKPVVGEPEGQQFSAAVESVGGSAGHENPVKEAEQGPEGQQLSTAVEPVEGSAGHENPVKEAEQEPEGQRFSAVVEPVEGSAGHENPVKEAEQEPEGQRFSAAVEPVEGSAGQEAPVKKTAGEPENAAGTDPAEDRIFRITCRNKISESIGGVEFVDGTGYTRDGFSASWFANKSGYTVSRADSLE